MAEEKKRGPGRPPGSKNKKTKSGASSGSSSGSSGKSGRKSRNADATMMNKEEHLAEFQAQVEREKRKFDVIWSITFIALGVFLAVTVWRNTTGVLGATIHDVSLGLFGAVAYAIPVLFVLFGGLLFMQKLQHLSGVTTTFSILALLQICVLNSARYIADRNPQFGFKNIVIYYKDAVGGKGGGAFGMELGSILVKSLGKPGLYIFSIALLIISVFLVANTPIARFFGNMRSKMEKKRLMKELVEAEKDKVASHIADNITPGTDMTTGEYDNFADDPDYSFGNPTESAYGFTDGSARVQPEKPRPSVFSGISKLWKGKDRSESISAPIDDNEYRHSEYNPYIPPVIRGAAPIDPIPEPMTYDDIEIYGEVHPPVARYHDNESPFSRPDADMSVMSGSNLRHEPAGIEDLNPGIVESQEFSKGKGFFGELKDTLFGRRKQSSKPVYNTDDDMMGRDAFRKRKPAGYGLQQDNSSDSGSYGLSDDSYYARMNGSGYGLDGSDPGERYVTGSTGLNGGYGRVTGRGLDGNTRKRGVKSVIEANGGYPGRNRENTFANARARAAAAAAAAAEGAVDAVDNAAEHLQTEALETPLQAADITGKELNARNRTRGGARIGATAAEAAAMAGVTAVSAAANANDRNNDASENLSFADRTCTDEELQEVEDTMDEGLKVSEDKVRIQYQMPPTSLLKAGKPNKSVSSEYDLQNKAAALTETLANFGVQATVTSVTQGASVTRYEIQPAVGVKVKNITRLADDIALNMRAKSLRIEAPIPGKAAVGIEIENDKPSPVVVRELIESPEFQAAESKISFVVGKDISGNNIVANLHDMPHLLIAGATGSGKSVCVNTIITSFLYKASPDDLKMIMIDPKVVELAIYNELPHMLVPVVTDPRKAAKALAKAVNEMDNRYEAFAQGRVKDLISYNNKYPEKKMPEIVIIIDELADLMMAASNDVENSICRLAQKARAAGMHLIVATQRPSVDVVTGLIKANIPSRIAFSVSSAIDSRTIIDSAGAEKLLGKGDMLFSPVGSTKPFRVQGPYISDTESGRIVEYWSKYGKPVADQGFVDAMEGTEEQNSSNGGNDEQPQDALTEDAIAFILKSKQASVSMLQRRFRIGYNRAARIIDEIEEKGIIGPSDGSRPRQVLMTEDQYYYSGSTVDAQDVETDDNETETVDMHQSEDTAVNSPFSRPADTTESNVSESSAMDAFNSLPESVRRQVMNSDD